MVGVEERLDDHCLCLRFSYCREGASQLAGAADQYWLKREAGTCGGGTQVFHEGSAKRGCGRGRGDNCDAAKVRNELTKKLQAFSSNLRVHCRPVTFPPGRAKLSIMPICKGAPAGAMTIGIVRVASMAAVTAGVKWATITSTPSRTNSSANSSARSLRPSV